MILPAYYFTPRDRLRCFEIRVGLDDEDIGNNELCYKQFNPVVTGASVMFICDHTLYGDWVSVNKTEESPGNVNLQLREVRMFGSNASEYIQRIVPGPLHNSKSYQITTK